MSVQIYIIYNNLLISKRYLFSYTTTILSLPSELIFLSCRSRPPTANYLLYISIYFITYFLSWHSRALYREICYTSQYICRGTWVRIYNFFTLLIYILLYIFYKNFIHKLYFIMYSSANIIHNRRI